MGARTPGARSCPGCGGARTRPFGTQDGYRWERCLTCGTRYVPHQVATEVLGELYDDYYEPTLDPTSGLVRARLRQIVQSLEPHRSTNRFLDIGFGRGALLGEADALGWACSGVERSPTAADAGRARGWTIAGSTGELPSAAFDVVTLVEVVEHLEEPGEVLAEARRLLRPGGALFLTTPHGRGLSGRLLGVRWPLFAAPEHLQLFSRPAVRRLVEAAGFARPSVQTEGIAAAAVLRLYRRPAAAAAAAGGASDATGAGGAPARRGWREPVRQAVNLALRTSGQGDVLKVRAVVGGGA